MTSPAGPLALSGVGVATAGGRRLLGPVTFSLAAGERVAVLGASGAGKSLLAAAVTGTLPADLVRTGHVEAPRVALVPQDSVTALNPLVRVGAQVARALRGPGGPGRRAVVVEVERLLASVGLDDPAAVARRYSAELSGGQRQRVCLAMALACLAEVVVADEATTALDVATEAGVLAVLTDLPSTLVVVTHDLTVAARTCERVLVLDDGRLVEDAPLPRLLADPRHPCSQRLVEHARHLVGAP